jgi:hypothetical protein
MIAALAETKHGATAEGAHLIGLHRGRFKESASTARTQHRSAAGKVRAKNAKKKLGARFAQAPGNTTAGPGHSAFTHPLMGKVAGRQPRLTTAIRCTLTTY